jgi:hypothetical protein
MKKNISLAVPIETCCLSRAWAAKHQTSVSCTVGRFLHNMAEDPGTAPFLPKNTVKL